MLGKAVQLVISVIVIIGGLETFLVRRRYTSVMWGRYMDYGPYHHVIGVIIMIIGLFFVYEITKNIIGDRRRKPPPRYSSGHAAGNHGF